MTTPEELLAEAERLDREATPGPWDDVRVGRMGNGSPRSHEEQICNADGVGALIVTHDGSNQGHANATFAARARELLPALARRVRERDAAIRDAVEAQVSGIPKDRTLVIRFQDVCSQDAMMQALEAARALGHPAVMVLSHDAEATTADEALVHRAREQEETIRRLSLALAEEQARSANRGASLEAVREALGDAVGQAGTLAEDVAALVNVVESVRGLPGMFRTGAEVSARNAAASGAQANRVKWGKAQEVWGRAADELERALLAGRKEG